MTVDWAELPVELLVRVIENYLLSVDDYVAFSSVCGSWLDATLACDLVKLKQNWARQMSWLMLTDGNEEICEKEYSDEEFGEPIVYYEPGELDNEEVYGENECSDNNLYRRNMLNLRQQRKCYRFNCPQGYGKACWGSAHGWIVSNGLDHKFIHMYLFNPLTKARLDLPSRRTLPFLWKNDDHIFRNDFIDKAVILKLPSSDVHGYEYDETLLVVVLYGKGLCVAIAKPGDTEWTGIYREPFTRHTVMDVSYYKDDHGAGALVFLNELGNIQYFDLHSLKTALRWYGCDHKYILDELWPKTYDGTYTDHFQDYICYVVDSGQDLLMVLRIFDLDRSDDGTIRDDDKNIDRYTTVDFKVYKLHSNDKSWEELQDLLDVALFVGNNATMSVCSTDVGCECNCIYFNDDYRSCYRLTKDKLGGNDMGISQMDDKTIRPLDLGNNHHTRSSYCCPLWFTPTL